jgi:hypothetical protein
VRQARPKGRHALPRGAWIAAPVLCILALPAPAQAAGGAFAVDDAEVGKPGECKVESWVSWASNEARDFIGVIAPACVANLGRPVELGAQYQRSRSDGEWGTSLALKAKTNILPVETGNIGVGVAIAAPFDLIAGQSSGFAVNVPVTYQFSEKFKVNVNAGYLHERAGQLDWFTWGAGFEWQFADKLTLIGETFGQLGRLPAVEEGDPPPPNSILEPRLQAGLRFTPVEAVDLDLIYGRNISGENANWITVGMNVRF